MGYTVFWAGLVLGFGGNAAYFIMPLTVFFRQKSKTTLSEGVL